ncbi:type ISP restriction/modification enzyme [Borrelia sp. RT5S]|uniref:type ISP restriction/modification enzyme n=1 Tax=Borrelia sp. RT5S TaxID=2898581 RepID=UPI001E2D6784|nr:type ISP restriction/modification enzyme [Borrelia sp. RT5S]UGQ16653.1 N-6 DNA methylase [Borrelia sp. RT5S]
MDMMNSRYLKYFQEYVVNIEKVNLKEKTEYTDRLYLQSLLNSICGSSTVEIQHEPQRDKGGMGSPDFMVRSGGNITGYIEVKKIGQDLDDTLKSDQIRKYSQLSNNILLTNYIEFIWIRSKNVCAREALLNRIDIENKRLKIEHTKASKVLSIIRSFFGYPIEKIVSIEKLASLLAERTRILKDLIESNLDFNLKLKNKNTLTSTYDLLNESIYNGALKVNEFSDSIAQTITYGLFLAKLNNRSDTSIDFYNIGNLIPSNFGLIQDILRLIYDIAVNKEYIDIKWILEELINIINNIDTKAISKQFSFTKAESLMKDKGGKDPYLYFYEDFLIKYDKELRKNKGVYYTPHPIVNFIIDSLNNILKSELNLENGFANREEATVLDFATGTGTFLLEVVKCILSEIPPQTGKQEQYIKDHILQNIYGFECLMAPYAVAHLKLSQYLKEVYNFELGSVENEGLRLQIFLTNTLDLTAPAIQENFKAFLPAISKENKLANEIKNKPILVILGNPPYNAGSKNNNAHILGLMRDYKKDLGERAIIALNDDYVKFIRFAEHNIENSNKGLLGIVTNNGFLDNITFRGMRLHLLKTFDEVYIINLHGNSRKKEKADDGSVDENVFDIQTGIAISIFIKHQDVAKKNDLARVYYKSIKGTRLHKYEFLNGNDISSINFEELSIKPPYHFFAKKNNANGNIYNKGFSLKEIFNKFNVGIMTAKDRIAIDFEQEELLSKLSKFACLSEEDARREYGLIKDSRDWKVSTVQKFLRSTNINIEYVRKITCRPFDNRYIYYSKHKGIIASPGYEIMKHMLNIEHNIGLLSTRSLSSSNFNHSFVASSISVKGLLSNKVSASYLFPLFLTEEQKSLKDSKEVQIPLKNSIKENFKIDFRDYINTKYCKRFDAQEILGYIYAILNSDVYRTRFIEFLKIDFPKIIFVDDLALFEKLSRLGRKLVNLHLLREHNELDKNIGIHTSSGNSDTTIEKIHYYKETEELFYNKSNKFINVPEEVYEFTIGSYQVLKSYLKCRKGRKLSLCEVEHLERVVKIIQHTLELQKQVDLIIGKCKEFGKDHL